MPLNIADKKALVAEINEIANNSISAVAAYYRGLSVSKMTELRRTARENKVTVRVFPNTLARRAFQETHFACMNEALTGPIVMMFSHEEPGAAARIASQFVKANEAFEVRALALDGQLLGPDQLKAVASLPSRDEAIALLMSVMNAPVTKLARTLSETYAQLVRVVNAVAETKK